APDQSCQEEADCCNLKPTRLPWSHGHRFAPAVPNDQLTCPARTSELHVPESRHAGRVRCSAGFGPAKSALSATAAKVDPHLLVPGAGAALLVSLDAAGDEVWSAVAVPVRHANARGLPAIVVGDEQL